MIDLLLRGAVRQNASWCALVSASHGVGADDDGRVWRTDAPPPLYHPDAVTLVPGVTADEVLRALAGRRQCSIKDSYADLDLEATGLEVLFDATWIGTSEPLPVQDALSTVVATSDGPDLGSDVVVLDVLRAGARVGRGTGHRHAAVIGLSNVGAPDPADLGDVFAALVAGARDRLGELPVVGYERHQELEPAVAQGFVPLGPLRVLVRPAGRR